MSDRRELRLGETAGRRVSLVRAFEERDRGGLLLPHAVRQEAGQQARAAAGDDEARFVAARAAALEPRLVAAVPAIERLRRVFAPSAGLLLPAVALAFVLGVASNVLGPSRAIHVLALPLLGVVAWNLAVLAAIVVRGLLPLPAVGRPRVQRWLDAVAQRALARWTRRHGAGEAERSAGEEVDRDALAARALGDFAADWSRAAAPLEAARVRRLLHAGALALAAGMVAGMYLRGVAFAYRATWESTFLGAGTVQGLLGAVLGPASALLGIAVPAVAPIRDTPGDAAPWIHLWAVTAALFVGLPRLLLLLVESARVARRRRRLRLAVPAGYLRRVRAAADPARRRVEVVPYSYRLAPAARAALERLLIDAFGARAQVEIRPTVEYGEALADSAPDGHLLLLFTLAQTPEVEVHGATVESARAGLLDGQVLIAAVDAGAYRQRLGGGDEDSRLASRRQAWDRVIESSAGIAPLHLDLASAGANTGDARVERLLAAAWPAGVLDDLRARAP